MDRIMSGWAGFWIMLGLFALAASLESVAEAWWFSRKYGDGDK